MTRQLIEGMAERCRALIDKSEGRDAGLPESLSREHLLWMCDRVEQNVDDWHDTKLHRWIGFVQCGMMANGMLDLDGAKAMFDAVKEAHGFRVEEGQDLIDHLDARSSFEIDIGGEG